MGDPYGDGHGQSETVYLDCNIDFAELKEAYKKSNIDVESQCEDYEDKCFNKAMAKMLLEKGKASEFITESLQQDIEDMFTEEFYDDDEEDFDLYSTDIFAVFWLCAAMIGNPEIQMKIVSINPPNIEIGGYGLF
jgi:hypothetical protein